MSLSSSRHVSLCVVILDSLRPPFLLPPALHRPLHFLLPHVLLTCTPTSTTWTPWKITCATPPRGATTPTTSPSPSQVVSPTTRSPTSSSTPRVPSPTLLRHRTRTWMTLRSASYSLKYTENTPDYRSPEGVFVSQSSLSVPSDRTVKPLEKSNIDQFSFGVRNTYSAHNQFPAITQAAKMVDRTVKPVGESSSSAQIRTLFDEQRQMIIAECCEKVSHHELQASSSRTRTPHSTRRITASAKGFS